ncbi:hypothetical protein IF803_08915 [Bradyrhizobium sp. UFLA06-06]
MTRVHRKKAGPEEPTSDNRRMRGNSGRRSLAGGLLNAWAVKAKRERFEWLNRPRLHIAVFEESRRDEELEELIATKRATFKREVDAEAFARRKEKRQQEIHARIGSLSWSTEKLKLFVDAVVAYEKDASIQNYLSIRQKFPEVEIQVSRFGGIDPLFALEADFRDQGINPDLIAGALDAVEPGVDALCVRLLELLSEREKLPKKGPGSIDRRRKAISDATVDYLIATIFEAYDWNEDVYRVPASLVVLIRHQLRGVQPDLDAEYRLRERKKNVAMMVAQELKPNERLSINRLKLLAGIPRTTAARWLSDADFQRWLDFGREQPWKELFKTSGRRATKAPTMD